MQKFVICHDVVGTFLKGDVVAEDQFPEGPERLLRLKAIRPAYDQEATMDRVTAPGDSRKSLDQQMHEKDQEIFRLRKEVNDLQTERQNRQRVQGNMNPPQATESYSELIITKDKVVRELQAKVHDLEAKLAEKAKRGRPAKDAKPEPEPEESCVV